MTPVGARMSFGLRHQGLPGIILPGILWIYVVFYPEILMAIPDSTRHTLMSMNPVNTSGIPADYYGEISSIEPASEQPNLAGVVPSWLDKQKLNIEEDYASLSSTEKILSEIQSLGRVLAKLDGRSLVQMPFALQGKFDDQAEYMLGFNKVSLHADYASFDVAAKVRFPFMDTVLYFAAAGLKYNNRSGLMGDSKLMLLQDYVIELNSGKSALIIRGFRKKSNRGTYIDMDCSGIKSINIGLEVVFNPNYLQPVNTQVPFVKAYADFSYSPESGFIVQGLNFPPFYFKQFRQAYFTVLDGAIDLDEKRTTMPYIKTYLDSLLQEGVTLNTSLNEWTGFYCREFSVQLGKNIVQKKDRSPLTIRAENLIIDDAGFTALVSLEKDLLTLKEGSAGGWPISLNRFTAQIVADQVKKFGFGGLIHVPVLADKTAATKNTKAYAVGNIASGKDIATAPPGESSCLKYTAAYDWAREAFDFTVIKMDSVPLSIPILFADLQLREGSYFTLTTGEDIRIEAMLNADVVMRGALSAAHTVQLPALQLERLWISNQKPFLTIASIHGPGESGGNLGKFPLSFKTISLEDYQPERYNSQVKQMNFTELSLNFGDVDEGHALKATTTMNVYFGVKDQEGTQQWVNKGLDIQKIKVQGTLPGIKKIDAELIFIQEDDTYGTAFGGGGTVEFKAVDMALTMACLFGSTGDAGFDFSYVDAAMDVSQRKTEASFQVQLMMAGYFKNMAREELSRFSVGHKTDTAALVLGGLFPENSFKPSLGSKGIKGGLIAKVGEGAILGLRLNFEQHPSQGQGLSTRFFLEGLAEIMPKKEGSSIKPDGTIPAAAAEGTDLAKQAPPDAFGAGAFGGFIRISVLNESQGTTLDAQLGVHGTVSSISVQAYAAYYKSPQGWHLFIGRPEARIALGYGFKANSDVVSAGVTFNAYFMMGNSPDMPTTLPLPYSSNTFNSDLLAEAYQSLAGQPGTNIFGNQALGSGKAFAFGAGVGLNVAFGLPRNNPTLSILAGADLGMDLLLTQSTPNCNQDGEGTPGINGWTMYGQLYAAISATILLKKFTIFQGGAGALIQGAFFNPTWGVGTWRFAYKVLWIAGEAQGVFKFGQPCQDFNVPVSAEEIIEAVYPNRPGTTSSSGQTMISINSDLLVDLKLPANRLVPQTITYFETGKTETYQLRASTELKVSNSAGLNLPGDIYYINDGYTVVFKPKQMLAPGTKITLQVTSTIFDQTSRAFMVDGEKYTQDTTLHFLVDPNGLLGLRTEDIEISYPLHEMNYFHLDEHPLMMISYGKPLPLQGYMLSGHLRLAGQTSDLEQSRLSAAGTHYEQKKFSKLAPGQAYEWIIRVTDAEGKQTELATITFSTSKYLRFQDKMTTATITGPVTFAPDTSGVITLNITAAEPLETFIKNNVAGPAEKNNTTHQYFARPFTWFGAQNTYNYFSKIYDDHIPYGKKNIVVTCSVDDASIEDQKLAKPADKIQTYGMYDYTPRTIPFNGVTMAYDIFRDFTQDYFAFRQLKPPVPPHYAQCSDYGLGVLPSLYTPGTYALTMRYFLPGFQVYSSSSSLLKFTLGQ